MGSWDVQVEPGEWPHGLPLLNSTLETVIFAQLCAADKAHLRSHSGAGCAEVLSGCSTAPEFALQPIIPYSRVGNSAH